MAAQDTTLRVERIDSSVISSYYTPPSTGNKSIVTPEISGRLVSTLGVNDIVKTISFKPGVSFGMEGSSASYVRGSGTGGNRVELNGVPLHRSSHLLGLVSSFPSEMISSMSFYTGGMKPSSGNQTSSFTEITLKSNIADKIGGALSVSPFMEEAFLEVPVGNTFTARASYRVSPALKIANKAITHYAESDNSVKISDIGGKSYDAMANAVWKPARWLSLDAMYFKTEDGFDYTYRTGAEKLSSDEKAYKAGLKINAGKYGTIEFSGYKTESSTGHKEFIYRSDARYVGLLRHLEITTSGAEKGVKLQYHLDIGKYAAVNLGASKTKNKSEYTTTAQLNEESSLDGKTDYTTKSWFAELVLQKENLIEARASVRPSNYKNLIGKDTVKFNKTDIHALIDFYYFKKHGIEATFDRAFQFYHVFEGLPSGWSQDLITACDYDFPAEMMNQAYLGVFGASRIFEDAELSYTLGTFMRKMEGLVSFKHISHAFGVHDNIDTKELVGGEGSSKGIELSLILKSPTVNANIAYTYSKSKRQYEELNFGKEFNFRFDRPHILTATGDVLFYKKKTGRSKTIEQRLSLAFIISSGHLMTTSQGGYDVPNPGDETGNGLLHLEDMSELNNYRLPLYFRTDVGYSFTYSFGKQAVSATLSVFNLFNKHNAYQYFYEDGQWKQLSILPIMPTLQLTWRF
ncbi:MAG: Plug domain-containing protein [Bacteroidales bacterium]|nr:Plug domain-containing protein [Bacteroidales bacterium]